MNDKPVYTIGVDFGTLSGRALLVNARTGAEIASAVHVYGDGVIDHTLPGGSKPLPHDFALQNPQDYLDVLTTTIPQIIRDSSINPQDVVGIATDFTACTMLPTLADGTPLCTLPQWRDEPHAWVKLWKHHASQPQADQINATAAARGEPWLPLYGGKYSSEWFFSKALQILQEAPQVYAAADRLIEAADWITGQLSGIETRNTCTAGYKAMVQKGEFPARDFFAALHPDFADVVDQKMMRQLTPLGARVGGLTPAMADKLGLRAGIAIAAGNVDAHVTAPAVKATGPGVMVAIMGTSTCHVLNGTDRSVVEGMCGVVDGGIVPDLYGYEAGQAAVGDTFAWFVQNAVPAAYFAQAAAATLDIYDYLAQEAARQAVGAHGLMALDWFNGNRSTLVDTDLTGLIVGMTLATRAPDIYRALIEATAYGTREIIEAFEARGIPVTEFVAAGGLPEKNALLCQIYADVLGRPITLAGSAQAPALGSAIFAAVAAGIYPNIQEAAAVMGNVKPDPIMPIPHNQAAYNALYAEYKQLYDTFGRGANTIMKRLKAIRNRAGEG